MHDNDPVVSLARPPVWSRPRSIFTYRGRGPDSRNREGPEPRGDAVPDIYAAPEPRPRVERASSERFGGVGEGTVQFQCAACR
jgi:hypothetical protein